MIEIDHLSQAYGDRKILSEVNLHIEKNERCALVGRNGAGKSTLIHSLLGLIPCKQGTIRLGGIPHTKEGWKRLVSYLPEKFSLYPQLSGYENITFFAAIDKATVQEEKIEKSLRAVNLWEHRNEFIKGYSKGMLQRLGLGIILYFDSEIMILDEPTSGLDPIGRKEILAILESLEDKTILLSSHYMDEIKQTCTHVAYLERGVITKYTVGEFLAKMHDKM